MAAEGPLENEEQMRITPIAHMESDLKEKFGIPRQSGLVPSLVSRVRFAPAYADHRAVMGLEGFSHIWLIWGFSHALPNPDKGWSPTVRPPRLGGNERMGVFATRSPFRPNSLGLSCVELLGIEREQGSDGQERLALVVGGADLLDGTPIYDVKPYVPYADLKPEARGGFAAAVGRKKLTVQISPALLERLPADKREAAVGILEEDPRPAYHDDPERLYGVSFAGYNLRFQVAGEILTVRDITPI